MKVRSKRWGLIVVLVVVSMSAGCWDYRDLERRVSVMGIGVDALRPEDGGRMMYDVTIEVPITPAGEGGTDSQSQDNEKLMVRSQNVTVAGAILAVNKEIDRLPLWEHVLTVVVSEDVARDGLGEIADGMIRSTLVNARARLFVVDGASAEEVIAYTPSLQPLASRFLRSFEEQHASLPVFARTQDFFSLDERLQEWGVVLLPRVYFSEDDRLTAEGAAVIRDGRLVDWLDEIEAEGANWWLGEINSSVLDFRCPIDPEEYVTLRLHPRSDKLKLREDHGELVMIGEFRTSGRIVSMARCSLDPSNASQRGMLERAAAKELASRIEKAADRAQRLNIDFLGFGLHVKRHANKIWKQLDWKETFPDINIIVSVQVSINDPGEWNLPPTFY